MPWSNTCPMSERKKFIEEWLQKEWSMTDLCAAYGISRKTGYKWCERFKIGGFAALEDDSRAPDLHPNATPAAVVERIVEFRHRHPFWGPRKIRERLARLHPDVQWPANSTIGDLLKAHGLVMRRRVRRRTPIYEGPFIDQLRPNDVWAMDFKGWFRTADGSRIDPFTVSDWASRYLIRCRAVTSTDGETVKGQLTIAFREYGLPRAIRSDNGAPFATVGLGGLSALSVWLIRLGITPERIRPAHPEENGVHERMHRTLKQQTANPPKENPEAQNEAFDRFIPEFNDERPHEALDMKTPSDVYTPSMRPFPKKLPEIEYPAGSVTRLVSDNGTIRFQDKRIYLTNALIFEHVRLEETGTGWNVWYGPILLGQLDLKRESVKRLPTKVLPMCPV